MTSLPKSICRRLQNLQQLPSVWEGDRRPIQSPPQSEGESEAKGDCILWVDGSEGVVRAMDMVNPATGPEGIVRTLLRAMEHPHSPARPARPQKIVVKDREILFFLRGVLQDLDIHLDYAPELPLIDDIFETFRDAVNAKPPQTPPQYTEALEEQAWGIWQQAPWEFLSDHQVLAIKVNCWDIQTLYVSVLGMLGLDYGILLYRSLESLKRFRERVLSNASMEDLEDAFLGQDCLFLTFDSEEDLDEDEEDLDLDLTELPWEAIVQTFGSLHPLEGLRSFLYEEESQAVLVALDALQRFLKAHHYKFIDETMPEASGRYRIRRPDANQSESSTITVTVSTMPQLAAELFEMTSDAPPLPEGEAALSQGSLPHPVVFEDLIPEGAITLFRHSISAEDFASLRENAESMPTVSVANPKTLPLLVIQTTRSKAKHTIARIRAAGGIQCVCFNPGEDPYHEREFELGLLQMVDGSFQLFAEFDRNERSYQATRRTWEKQCNQSGGYCGVAIAMGSTGSHAGRPPLKYILGLFEVPLRSPQALGLNPMKLMPAFLFDGF
jgi:hypothetical protein